MLKSSRLLVDYLTTTVGSNHQRSHGGADEFHQRVCQQKPELLTVRHESDVYHVWNELVYFVVRPLTLLLSTFKLANAANGFGFSASRSGSPKTFNVGHFTVFRIMYRNLGRERINSSSQSLPVNLSHQNHFTSIGSYSSGNASACSSLTTGLKETIRCADMKRKILPIMADTRAKTSVSAVPNVRRCGSISNVKSTSTYRCPH